MCVDIMRVVGAAATLYRGRCSTVCIIHCSWAPCSLATVAIHSVAHAQLPLRAKKHMATAKDSYCAAEGNYRDTSHFTRPTAPSRSSRECSCTFGDKAELTAQET